MFRLSTFAFLGAEALAADDECSMLQVPVQKIAIQDATPSECRCPGYFQAQCEAEAAQGCFWGDDWCQCSEPPPIIGGPGTYPITLPPLPVTAPPLPVTEAPIAPVTIPPAAEPVLSPCEAAVLAGESWTLVRHAAPGNQWHGATDRLGGTDVYGDPAGGALSASEWSIAFNVDDVGEFLFATGDCENWLVASKDAVIGEYYSDQRQIMRSSTSSEPYTAQWLNRAENQDGYPHDEDPWISLGDHGASVANGGIIYGENHFGQSHAELVLPVHNGANVFVRLMAPSSPCAAAVEAGESWTLVRHAAPGNQWHMATDRLGGTDVYGDSAGGALSATEWSIAFNVDDVSEFLFATGDCENWLVASKDAVIGEYYSDQRQIMRSSTSSEPYTAQWLNRAENQDGYPHDEDPWISLGDHGASVANGGIIYGENHFGQSHAELVLPVHNGANVFIKF